MSQLRDNSGGSDGLVQHLGYAVITTDGDDTITTWNRMAEHLFGWSAREALGRKASETIFRRSVPQLYAEGSKEKWAGDDGSSGAFSRLEKIVQHRTGTKLAVEVIIAKAEPGEGNFYIINACDISERLRSKRALKNSLHSQKALTAILQLSLEDISLPELLTNSLKIIFTLEQVKLLPYGAILLVAEQPAELVLTAQVGLNEEHLRACATVPFGRCHCGRAAATNTIQFSPCLDARHDIYFQGMEPHGHYCLPIFAGGRVLGVIALYVQEGHGAKGEEQECLMAVTNILAGVIERKKMEKQRAGLIEKLHSVITAAWNEKLFTDSIIQSLQDGLIILDPAGVITMINIVGVEILSQFSATPIQNDKKLIEIIDEKVARTLSEPTPPANGIDHEIILTTLIGEKRVLAFNTVPRKDSLGQEVGCILSFRDITEAKRAQVEMEKMNHLITVAEIASAVAHEVRNPLAGIKTMSQSIEENMAADDGNKEYLFRIIRQVDRLNELLTNFFTYAKPVKPRKKKINLIEIVTETKQLVQDKLISKRIKLYESYQSGLPAIFADPNQIQQVFLNLMLNSIEAIQHDGIIEIEAKLAQPGDIQDQCFPVPASYNPASNYIKVTFRDNGCGMTSEVRERAFKPFFSTKAHGTGLGLAIVYRILKENSAYIWLDSTIAAGTLLTLLFET